MSLTEANDTAERRTNQMLRYALDKYLQGDHGRVNEFDVYLFRATHQKLAKIPDPSPGQSRLRGLVEGALAQYAEIAARLDRAADSPVSTEAPADLAAPAADTAEPLVPVVDAAIYFESGTRRPVPDVDGILLDAQVRVFEQTGSLTLQGDVPEDALVIVRDGGLVVHGMLLGHAFAGEHVKIHGNVQGGHLVSQRGNIEAGHIFSGAFLSAPQGNVQVSALQRAGRIFAGRELRVTGDVRGGVLYGGNVQVQGNVSGAEIHVLGSLSATEILSDAREPTRVFCRSVLTAQEYGRGVPEDVQARIRGISKAQFRAVVGVQVLGQVHAELCAAQRAVLYHLAAPAYGAVPLDAFRTAQCQAVYFAILATVAEGMTQVAQDALEADPALLRSASMYVGEECHLICRGMEHDIASLPDELVRGCKETFLAGFRQLQSLAKKLYEATLDRGDVPSVLATILTRALEWRGLATEADARLAGMQPAVLTAIGSAGQSGQPGDKLNVLMQHGIEQARKDPLRARLTDALLFRVMLANVERYQTSLKQWTGQMSAAQKEWDGLRNELSSAGWLLRRQGPAEHRSVRADRFSSGVLLSTSPTLTHGEDVDVGAAIQLTVPVQVPTMFVLEGAQLHRTPRRG